MSISSDFLFLLCSPAGGSTIFGFALRGTGKESVNLILDPDDDPDLHQNLTTSKFG